MEEEAETQHLLVNGVAKSSGRYSRRSIVVEPLLIMYAAAGFPMNTIRSQFMYQKVAESMNVDLNNFTSNASQCDVNSSNPDYITRERVQSENATLDIYISLVKFLPSFFCILAYGVIGDRIGRRLLMILPCIGSLTEAILYICIIKFDLSMYFFFLESIQYLFGGMETMFFGAFAYLADTVPPEKRSFRMTVLDVVSIANGAIASLFVGYWIKAQGFLWPLVFVACGKTLALIYAIFFIPETVQKSNNARKITLKSLFSGMSILFYDNGTNRRMKINLLLLAFTLGSLFKAYAILTLFEMNSPLCWGPVLIGYFSSVSMLLKCFAMLFAAGILKKYVSDKWQLFFGNLSSCIEYIYLAFVSTTVMMFIAPVLGCIGMLSLPMTRAILTTYVEKTEQASMFSLMAVSQAITSLVSSIGTNKLYAASLMFMEGLVFLADGFVHILAMGIICLYIYKTRHTSTWDLNSKGPKGNIQE